MLPAPERFRESGRYTGPVHPVEAIHEQNWFQNPLPFSGAPPISQAIPRRPVPWSELDVGRQLWTGTAVTNPDLLFNTIPDQSLIARWPQPVPQPKDPGAYVYPIWDGPLLYY